MSYRSGIALLMALAFATTLASSAAGQQRDAEVALQQAMQVEQVQGDLERAIRLYQDIVAHHGDARAVAAKALLHLGQCYEKLGRTEAMNAYQRLVREYGDQSGLVAQARARLAALQPTMTSKPGPVARLLLNPASNPSDRAFDNPRVIVPSPDGHRIAYWQSGPDRILIRDMATGEKQRVASSGPTEEFMPPVWSADAKRLAFTVQDTVTKVSVIRILDLSTRETRTLPVPVEDRAYLVDWTRDGRYFLYNDMRARALRIMAVDDGTTTTVCDSVWPWERATFSPDGRFVAYAFGSDPVGSHMLSVQPVGGGPRHEIVKSGGGNYLHPLWSPDGSAIAYQETDGIWVVPMADGISSGPPRLAYRTESPRWAVAWTAAGGVHYTANEQRNIPWRVEVDPGTGQATGSEAHELTEYPGGGRGFSWSPDGRRVAITGWYADLTIYSLDTEASTSYHDLEQDGGIRLRGGIWSPDGRELWYEHASSVNRESGTSLKALDLNTGRVRKLFTLTEGGAISVSADGRTMAFMRPGSDGESVEMVVAETGQNDGQVVATIRRPNRIPVLAQPLISPRGDKALYIVQRQTGAGELAGTLWVVESDGTDARAMVAGPRILSATWDPTGRLIAYTAREQGSRNTSLRVIDVGSGQEHDVPVPSTDARLQLVDWSKDGRYIGFLRVEFWWEYWAVQGVLDGGH